MYPFNPVADNGLTTAINATVGAASGNTPVPSGGGNLVMITVGTLAGLYIRFGRDGSSVSTANGFRLPPDYSGLFSIPRQATTIYYIREDAVDTSISLLFGDGGI